jgi:hypothetical protein
MKKTYASPRLTVHGDVRKITLKNGDSFVDVPQGTPCCPDASS